MLTLHACCLINRTTFALGKNPQNYLFSRKLAFQKLYCSRVVDGLHSNVLSLIDTSECGAVVPHRTSDVKVSPFKCSNPTSGVVFCDKPSSFTLIGRLC